MRRGTDPGVAPPAPGSVQPPPRPPVPRRAPGLAAPLSGAYAFTEDEAPTKPDNALQPELLQLVRIVDSMPTVERRRFIAMAESYRKCSLGRRVLIEEMTRELGMKP